MQFTATNIKGLYSIHPNKLKDDRGEFFRSFCKNEFKQIGFQKEFVQFNHSLNYKKGTIRGMHFQMPPYAEYKLISCVQGAVYDVAVDLRKGSETFLHYFAIELNAHNNISLLIPEGFAHGFQALQDNSILIYRHTQFYTPSADAGIRFDDPSVNIQWPLPAVAVSAKDKSYQLINNQFKGIEI
ncbi:MAG: dTDP-4-dehydrorhamnose 3,5-epimerase [Bacteroidetes bacterium]|nr:dTDP-4-dehydrorhamnose 3,5-epimerase [Bacteroidota bacterium]